MERLIRFSWKRKCPACGDNRAKLCRKPRGEGQLLHSESFSARKKPEAVYPAYRRCQRCRLVYASPTLPAEDLAYESTANIANEEAEWAASSYSDFLSPWLNDLPTGTAIDIGCGDGAFLSHLDPEKFPERIGFDPGAKVARPGIQLEPHFFAGTEKKASLVTAFQVLEHVPHPLEILEKARTALVPGGLLFVVAHDERAWTHRALGKHSPMLDLQHFQLFSRGTLRRALETCGFRDVQTFPFKNTYPLHYWAKLAPIPTGLKQWLRAKPLGKRPVELALGNFAALARG